MPLSAKCSSSSLNLERDSYLRPDRSDSHSTKKTSTLISYSITVFYNRLLQCYVLIDLKIDKLTHQDLGQMQMYVNYYDRHVRQEWEKPTIGILLCKEKKDALIKLTLPEDANIYAAEYALYLPDKKELQERLQQWILEFDKEEDL